MCTPQLTTLILDDPGGGPLLLMTPYCTPAVSSGAMRLL